MNVGIGTVVRSSFSGNSCLEFLVLCLCIARSSSIFLSQLSNSYLLCSCSLMQLPVCENLVRQSIKTCQLLVQSYTPFLFFYRNNFVYAAHPVPPTPISHQIITRNSHAVVSSTHPRKFRQSFTRDRFFKTLDDALSRKICGGYIKNSYRYHDFFYSSSFLFIFHFSGRHTIGHLFEMICCNWCDCSLIQCSSCTVMLQHIGLHLAIYFLILSESYFITIDTIGIPLLCKHSKHMLINLTFSVITTR